MKKVVGLLLIVLGALGLIYSYVDSVYGSLELVDTNYFTGIMLLLIIAGIVTHIYLTKHSR